MLSPSTNEDGGYDGAMEPDISQLANVDGGLYRAKEGTKEQDVSPLMDDVDGGLTGTTLTVSDEEGTRDGGHHVHYQLLTAGSPSSGYRQEDVSPPTISDGGQHGAKEEGEG